MKQFITVLLCGILLIGIAAGAFAVVLDHFGVGDITGITKKVKNPENLMDASAYGFKSGTNFEGVTITYDADGVLTLHGQADADVEVCLGEFYKLDKSVFYTMSVYCPEPARTTTGTKVTDVPASSYAGEVTLASGSFAESYTFTSAKLQYARVYITIKAGDAFDYYTVAPVLVEGKSIQQFYINETIEI